MALIALCCPSASAHVFAQPYTLPVPFAIYGFAATAALLLSFIVAGVFSVVPASGRTVTSAPTRPAGPAGHVVSFAGRAVSLFLLLFSIVTGFAGNQNAFVNFNMTFFWIIFVLAVPYTVAFTGNFYEAMNPWKTLVLLVEGATGLSFNGRVRYPPWLGYAPGLILYMAFIWLELFGELLPRGLSAALSIYTLINVWGAYVFGIDQWFEHGEFFGIFLRLVGKMAPWAPCVDSKVAEHRWSARLRAPFLGLLDEPAGHLTLVLFILFMLSSTAFDGLHATLPWVSIYWKSVYPEIARWVHSAPGQQFRTSTQIYYVWQWTMLFVSPFFYLFVFAAFMSAVKALTRSTLSVTALVLRFALTLVPIAFVYHVTHYYTVLLAQGSQIAKLISDPFGFGWDLFGTARETWQPVMLDVGAVWLTQVALIVGGHIVSVYLAHLEALRIFGTPRRAALSQLPMLFLMMFFTNLGLWILSLPLASG